MNNKFLYSPDAGETTPAAVNTTPGLPVKDLDFMDTAVPVAKNWLLNPGITLVYTNAEVFNRQVQEYVAILTGRLKTGANRPSQTQTLDQQDALINAAVKEVRVYIEKKYKTANAKAQFPKFGIGKYNQSFQLPKDRNLRIASLKLMAEAIEAEGFGKEEYGTEFWNRLLADYGVAMKEANVNDGKVSLGVSGKNNLKKEIKKVMKSLRRVLEGNYPDSFQAILREWGWQKEDY